MSTRPASLRPVAVPAPAGPGAAQPRFVFQAAGRTHVQVAATDRALGVRELMAALKADPKLHNCVIEQCRFDDDGFSALLRIEG